MRRSLLTFPFNLGPHLRSTLIPALLLAPLSMLAQQPVGEVFSSDASLRGSIVLAGQGTKIMSGSSLTAGVTSAALRLERGGELRVCPGTTVSVTASTTGRDLMLAMGAGGIETRYDLKASADTIMTPDFRILLAGPGRFYFAVKSDARGNTCVRALPGNSSSMIISELMGDGVYQVKPDENVYFPQGQLARATKDIEGFCGCPEVEVPVQRAAVPAFVPPVQPVAPATERSEPARAAVKQPEPIAAEAGEMAPVLAEAAENGSEPPNEAPIQITVDAPFVFRAEDEPARYSVPAAPVHVRVSNLKRVPLMQASVLPPPSLPPAKKVETAEKPKKKRNAFVRFFAAIFGRKSSN